MPSPPPHRQHFFGPGVWRTLRFRLAVWNAAVVVVTALVTLIGLRQGVRWALVHELDQELIDDARGIALEFASMSPGNELALQNELDRWARGHERHGWYVKLLDDRGRARWESADAQADDPPPSNPADLSPRTLHNYRIVDHRLSRPSGNIRGIRVGATLDRIGQDMARIDRGVLLAAGAVMFAAPLCGYFLAARAARAVGEIIETASRLRPSHLDERLPIRGTGDELDQLAQTVNSLLDRIAAYLDTKRDFLANAAHELRTPLAAIRSSVEVALSGGDQSAEELEELLIDVISECSSLEALVNQLLLLSEVEADLPEIKYEPVRFRRLVEKSVDMFTGVADARGVSLCTGRLEDAVVDGNAAHLRQVINNLLDNAVKYTPAGGSVSIDLSVDDDARRVLLVVSDTGQGIAPHEQQHIFERFYRAESARSRGPGAGGTGLGLSICLSVVQSHGGDIACESQRDRGTTFTVTLPLGAAFKA